MTVSLFSISALLLSLIITVRAFCAMLRSDRASRAEGRRAVRLLAVLLPVVIALTMAMYRYTALAAWSKSILPAKMVAFLRSCISIIFGTRSFSLMLQTALFAITIPTILLSLYVIVTEFVVVTCAYQIERLPAETACDYHAPQPDGGKTFLQLRQLRI